MASWLKEYRCTCGKLFFKGLLSISVLEIKCRRCGNISLIRELNIDLIAPASFGVLLDHEGLVINVCNNVSRILGWSAEELIGKSIASLDTEGVAVALYQKLKSDQWAGQPYKVTLQKKNGGSVELYMHVKSDYVSGAKFYLLLWDVVQKASKQ